MQNDELRRAQEQLEQSRDRYRNLYNTAPVAYLTLDPKGTIVEANAAAEMLLEAGRQELTARPLSSWMTERHADELHLHLGAVFREGTKQSCRLTFGAGDPQVVTEGTFHSARRWRALPHRARRSLRDGAPRGDTPRGRGGCAFCTLYDAASADARLSQLVARDVRHRRSRSEARRPTGEEYLQRIVHPSDRDDLGKELTDIVERPRPYALDYRVVTDEGQVRWVKSIAAPSRTPPREP